MASRITRRNLLKGVAGAGLAANLPMPAIAQNKPVKIGLLTVKTGPLAQGGIQMEQGANLFLKDRNSTMAWRKSSSSARRARTRASISRSKKR